MALPVSPLRASGRYRPPSNTGCQTGNSGRSLFSFLTLTFERVEPLTHLPPSISLCVHGVGVEAIRVRGGGHAGGLCDFGRLPRSVAGLLFPGDVEVKFGGWFFLARVAYGRS